MDWVELYTADDIPTASEIADYINNPLWKELNDFLVTNYGIEPSYSYSRCSEQPGWNVKYQKAGRSLCTLYPMPGYFIALVVIGTKEKEGAEFLAPSMSKQVQRLLNSAGGMGGSRWLMINVTDEQTLDDVERLIQLRRQIKKKKEN